MCPCSPCIVEAGQTSRPFKRWSDKKILLKTAVSGRDPGVA
ncbi:hypothetical protein RHECNPAF_1700020 [Rhizobium etli CNPAF512]|nr:hypothetical protein RHECNPAF_1700020 [Rhizobium etli CNPAF512]